jgi:hypothetical protein
MRLDRPTRFFFYERHNAKVSAYLHLFVLGVAEWRGHCSRVFVAKPFFILFLACLVHVSNTKTPPAARTTIQCLHLAPFISRDSLASRFTKKNPIYLSICLFPLMASRMSISGAW